jgi:crotonobetainyl-CoA:carnitine CoA-transferase CaiB-like acyl-CoA transferase
MTAVAIELTRSGWSSIGGQAAALAAVTFTGEGALPSTYAVTDLASAAVATAALSVAELAQWLGAGSSRVTVDRRLASFWFGSSIRPIGWDIPEVWDELAGDYHASDGWIRLHTNAPHHRTAAERVLGRPANKNEMARAVALWRKHDLETAIIEAGGCAAEMRSTSEWADHPQGRAIASEPLVHIAATDFSAGRGWTAPASRPLAGIRVLDLTRVLAGPVASRFLAGYGAQVLRIDPLDWNEPALVPEVTLGKRCTRLDLKDMEGRATFETLLSTADVFVHGYRPGALDRLGYDAAARRALSPGLIDVGLNAYGYTGPWEKRRGFDSLVQMSTGIADTGMRWKRADKPVPLPAQALDHATGYLMAAAAIRGITQRLIRGVGMEARLSLARTAKLLFDQGVGYSSPLLVPETGRDVSSTIERTDWGDAQRLIPPVCVEGAQLHWSYPATNLGTAKPHWNSG